MATTVKPTMDAGESATTDEDSLELTSLQARAGSLTLHDVTKEYGALRAMDGVSLEVRSGEFLTLLGPSGSGKTTTLQVIAGFVSVTSGDLLMDGQPLTAPPHKREIGMVFQNYALFPHMTAARNVDYPLKVRRVPKLERQQRVKEVLAMVGLADRGDHFPRQLSGGQQQRVALARALVFRPRVVLLDEPLGALDKKLREHLQLEIKRIQHETGITMVYVTHDQEEALVMSDRIAVFRDGRVEQVGSPKEVYEAPASRFVADFVGESNLFVGRLEMDERGPQFKTGALSLTPPRDLDGLDGRGATLMVRPERLRLLDANGRPEVGANAIEATIEEVTYLGNERKYTLAASEDLRLICRHNVGETDSERAEGDTVVVWWRTEDAVLVAEGETH